MSRRLLAAGVLLVALVAAALVYSPYDDAITSARARIASGAQVVQTACGPIQYAAIGRGDPLLVIHGAGGGFDQGLDIAWPFELAGFLVIAPSRFGYLETPLPTDASAEAQARAHACLLDALGIREASGTTFLFDSALRSDFLFWALLRGAPSLATRAILATPPEVVANAPVPEQARVDEMMTHILPVSPRRLGLINDATVTSTLPRYPLERITAPTLVLSAQDDLFGTWECARYTAQQIAGARFLGFPTGGHLLVGHEDELIAEIVAFLRTP